MPVANAPDHDAFLRVACDLLSRRVRVRFRAEGWSMHPTIRSGDVVEAEAIAPGAVRPGDILLYCTAWRVLAHRVVAIEGQRAGFRLLLRGDACSSNDAPIAGEQVIGRVVAVRRHDHWRRLDTSWNRLAGPMAARIRHRLADYRSGIRRLMTGQFTRTPGPPESV